MAEVRVGAGKQVVLVHATAQAIAPIEAAFADVWPEAQLSNVLDDGLLPALEGAGEITPRIVARVCLLATYATETGADAVLFTCSAFASAIDEAKRRQRTPVFKADEAMIDMALRAGPRIGVLATLHAAAAAVEAQIHGLADGNGEPVTVVSRTLDQAREARAGGDIAAFDRLIAEGASRLSQHVDVICLAQYSMARAQDAAKRATEVPLLAGPQTAASRLRSQLAPNADASSGLSGGA